jgi:hypothetical protein
MPETVRADDAMVMYGAYTMAKFNKLMRSGWVPPPIQSRRDGNLYDHVTIANAGARYLEAVSNKEKYSKHRLLFAALRTGSATKGVLANKTKTGGDMVKDILDGFVKVGLVSHKKTKNGADEYSPVPKPWPKEAEDHAAFIERTATAVWRGPFARLTHSLLKDKEKEQLKQLGLTKGELERWNKIPSRPLPYYGPKYDANWARTNEINRHRNEEYFLKYPERVETESPGFWADTLWKYGVDELPPMAGGTSVEGSGLEVFHGDLTDDELMASREKEQPSVSDFRESPAATSEVAVPSRKVQREPDKEIGPDDVLNLSPESSGDVELSRPKNPKRPK